MLPDTIYQSKLVHNEMRRERSLAIHDNLMHLPKGESVLNRLLRRLRAVNFRKEERMPRTSLPEGMEANRPAFSK
jgi:hypothetical protein